MAQENWQKYKLLKLLEPLRQKTDEQNPLSTSQICNKLGDMGMWNWVGKEKGYYIRRIPV